MSILVALGAVAALAAIAYAGTAAGLGFVFGVVLPYAAFAAFVVGVIARVVKWGRAPVPFRIPTTCGQEKSLPWIKRERLDNPFTTTEVIGRMLLEVLAFRSLFRNTKTELTADKKLAYGSDAMLWLAGLVFHWTFLIVLLRHLRFFTQPVPRFVSALQAVDGFFQVGLPTVLFTGLIFLAAVTYLFLRRVLIPQVRYISLPQDYFPVLLLMGIAGSGILLRYFFKTDLDAVKQLAMGLASFSPKAPEGVSPLFYVHLFLVSALFAYFPLSKLTHMAGVFLSPTRNLANNNRAVHHENPWNYPVKVHTYEEYEEEFGERMIQAGIPVDHPHGGKKE
jgi:nitrate reductase gamma subunit